MKRQVKSAIVGVASVVVFGSAGVYAASIVHIGSSLSATTSPATPSSPPAFTTSNSAVHTFSTESQHWTIAQAQQALKNASDPGLPAVVGSVNGELITNKEFAQMEVIIIHRQGSGTVGSATVRQQAFLAITSQYVEQQEATTLGLIPSPQTAEAQIAAQGLSNTPQEVHLVQLNEGIQALYHHVVGLHNPHAAKSWNHYLQLLRKQAHVINYLPNH